MALANVEHNETIGSPENNSFPGITIERPDVIVVKTNEEFNALESDWNELVLHADVTIFQTFEWLYAWWQHFGNQGELYCLVFKIKGRVIGIVPLYKLHVNMVGLPIATHLQFIGRGISDYVDIIAVRNYEVTVLDALAAHLHATKNEWDIFDCEDVNERSPVVRFFRPAMERYGIKSYEYQGNICPRITLPTKEDVVTNKKGPMSSYNFKRKYKKLREASSLHLDRYRFESDDLQKGIDMFSDIHGRRWKSLGYPSAFDEESHKAFHVDVARRFARRDWLRLYFLSVNETPLSVCFDFNYNDTIYMYQSNAHGSDELMKTSPGFLVRAIAMEEGVAEGMKYFDFLRGTEAYKYTEGEATETKNWLIRFSGPTMGGSLRFKVFLGYELLRKSFSRARWEYFEFRRFLIAKNPTPVTTLQFLGGKILALFKMGLDFILRYFLRGRKNNDNERN